MTGAVRRGGPAGASPGRAGGAPNGGAGGVSSRWARRPRRLRRGCLTLALSSAGMGLTLIVDGANVMGSRADGWWRDRAGAMARLHGELAALASRGIPGPVPDG